MPKLARPIDIKPAIEAEIVDSEAMESAGRMPQC